MGGSIFCIEPFLHPLPIRVHDICSHCYDQPKLLSGGELNEFLFNTCFKYVAETINADFLGTQILERPLG